MMHWQNNCHQLIVSAISYLLMYKGWFPLLNRSFLLRNLLPHCLKIRKMWFTVCQQIDNHLKPNICKIFLPCIQTRLSNMYIIFVLFFDASNCVSFLSIEIKISKEQNIVSKSKNQTNWISQHMFDHVAFSIWCTYGH